MNTTTIDWPWKPLYTWNPVTGCLHGCGYCYARKIANRWKAKHPLGHDCSQPDDVHIHYKRYKNSQPYQYGFSPTFHETRLTAPDKKKPLNIFVCDMADLFGDWIPKTWIWEVIHTCIRCPQHTFMFLTKNPKRYAEFEFPGNCWLGSTMTTSYTSYLSMSKTNRIFVSIEPILTGGFESINFSNVDLIIIGADSTPGAKPPKREWVDSIKHPNIWYKENLRKHYPEFKNET